MVSGCRTENVDPEIAVNLSCFGRDGGNEVMLLPWEVKGTENAEGAVTWENEEAMKVEGTEQGGVVDDRRAGSEGDTSEARSICGTGEVLQPVFSGKLIPRVG